MKTRIIPLLVIAGIFVLCFWMVEPAERIEATLSRQPGVEFDDASVVAKIDGYMEGQWAAQELQPAEAASDLLLLRRLALSLMGTIPSLEEIRQFELDDNPRLMARWTQRYLEDPRFADYFAERLARCFVGVEGGQFIIFRRDRFVSWLSERLRDNEPYDSIVRQMIASNGLWTGEPQTNFITSAVANENLDENKLASRSVRAFLGQSMDCAQCHDHPFDDQWKQFHFEGIAAQFGQAQTGALGVSDNRKMVYEVEDRDTLEKRQVPPAVPFGNEWVPAEGTPREQFAQWLTHRENRRFSRAISNRVWGLLFGRPYYSPVDDMENPPESEGDYDVLDFLADDFVKHNYDLRRLIFVITSTRAFQLESRYQDAGEFESNEDYADTVAALDDSWGIFPMTRLRPEQIIGSMLQAASIQTIDQNSHLFVRAQRFFRERDFVKEYGDLGDQELVEQTGTIPQALLRMNSDMTRESVKSELFAASGRISGMSTTNDDVVESSYLVCLSRRPESDELDHFLEQLGDFTDDRRRPIIEDLFWTLFNSPEFSWNH